MPKEEASLPPQHRTAEAEEEALPLIYFTELMGVAFGLSPRSLGLNKHFRDPVPALRHHSLVT